MPDLFPLSWGQRFSEPVRVGPQLGAAHTQYVTGITVPGTVVANWIMPFGDPVRIRAGFNGVWQVASQGRADPEAGLRIFTSWSEPVRVGLQLGASHTQYITGIRVPAPVALTFWGFPFSEPVRVRPGLHAARQQFFATDAKWTPIVQTDLRNGWLMPFGEPVRPKRGQHPARQQAFTIDAKWGNPVSPVDGWFRQWTEPVRSRVGLRTALQQTFTTDWNIARIPVPPVDSWHEWLAEPVRHKLGLNPGLQQFWTIDWNLNPPPIEMFWAVTELGDIGLLFIQSGTEMQGCLVTFTEIEVEHGVNVTFTEI